MIYYIHGYLSGPDSTKGSLLKKKLRVKPIKYRDCEPEDLVISECLIQIKEEIKNDENAILIGSSLGGLLAAKTALENSNVKNLILLNPAIVPPDFNIKKIRDMPQRILRDMQDKRLFTEKIKSNIFIIIGTRDDVVPNEWVIEFAMAQSATIKLLNDDHSLTQNLHRLPNIISKFLK